ncbi:MAG: hypothetical protein N2510_02330 [Ignavibacteria bacterium]|nr:hypothetical protein [Ignavibacteria bacterium]
MKTYCIIFSFILLKSFYAQNIQDSLKKNVTDSSVFLIQDNMLKYHNPLSPDTVSRKRILWYPIKTFEDLLTYLPGYYLRFLDVGQMNFFYFNQLSGVTFFKHGRPFTDDPNFLSRSEVEQIETDEGFAANLYGYPAVINIIDRQMFRNRPYTEINFYQDRYENLFLDASYHQNILKNLNINFGITKHSYEGHYVNSRFDKWLGRLNFNYSPFRNINFFSYFNYGGIERGLNGGINGSLVDVSDKDVMFNRTRAVVNNPTANEIKERFDADAGTVIKWSRKHLSRLQLFGYKINSSYEDSSISAEWVSYVTGVRLVHIYSSLINGKINLISRSEAGFDGEKSVYGDTSARSKSFGITEYLGISLKGHSIQLCFGSYGNGFNNLRHYAGFRLGTELNIGRNEKLSLDGFYKTSQKYYRAKLKLEGKPGNLGAEFYQLRSGDHQAKGLNFSAELYLFKFRFISNYTLILKLLHQGLMPKQFGTVNLAYSDSGFRNKFEYRIGFQSRFWSGYTQYLRDSLSVAELNVPSNFTLDFYVKARVGRVYFGLVSENILNRLIYNSAFYPFTGRGGLFNFISRFDITWNFLD